MTLSLIDSLTGRIPTKFAMNEKYLWSFQGRQGVLNGDYIGFFPSKLDALAYSRENLVGQITLYKATFEDGSIDSLEISEAELATAS